MAETDYPAELRRIDEAGDWDVRLTETRDRIRILRDELTAKNGLTADFVRRMLDSSYHTLGNVEYRDLRRIAEDNQQQLEAARG
jgi:hypothetical protein